MPGQRTLSHHKRKHRSHDSGLIGQNAQRTPAQATGGPDVSMGSEGSWCQEAEGRRSTTRGEPDAEARAPSKLGRPSGLVHFSTSDTIQLDRHQMRLKRMRTATITGARLMQEQLTESGFRTYPVLVTLTYALIDNWSSKHVTDYLKCCREWFRRRGHAFHYCWVAELQQRGAVHYHVIIWMPRKLRLPKPDKSGWWPHGFSKIEKSRNPVGYLASYAKKGSDRREFPRGLRLHGRGGLTEKSRVEMRWWASPSWVRQWLNKVCDVRRAEGGGFYCVDSGEWRPSPYRVVLINGLMYLVSADF